MFMMSEEDGALSPYISLRNTVGPLKNGYADPPAALIDIALRDHSPMVGVVWHDGIGQFGTFIHLCRKHNILPALGFPIRDGKYILYAYPTNPDGWKKIVSIIKKCEEIDVKSIEENKENFIIFTGGQLGQLYKIILGGNEKKRLLEYIYNLKSRFNNVFIDLSFNRLPVNYKEEEINKIMIELAELSGTPFLLVSDGRYRDHLGRSLDLLIRAGQRRGGLFIPPYPTPFYDIGDFFYEDTEKVLKKWGIETYKKSLEGMKCAYQLLSPLGEYITSTLFDLKHFHKFDISDRLNSFFLKHKRLLIPLVKYAFPESKGWDQAAILFAALTLIGMEIRYNIPILNKRYFKSTHSAKSLIYEILKLIKPPSEDWVIQLIDLAHNEYVESIKDRLYQEVRTYIRHQEHRRVLYLLDLMAQCQAEDILTHLRGSAASSSVLYALGLSRLDPIPHNIPFERFLSEHRLTPPDIDFEVSAEKRHHIVESLISQGAKQLISCNTWGKQSAKAFMHRAISQDDERVSPTLDKLSAPLVEHLSKQIRNLHPSPSSLVCLDEVADELWPTLKDAIPLSHDVAAQLGVRKIDILSSQWLDLLAEVYRLWLALGDEEGDSTSWDKLVAMGCTYGIFHLDASPQSREIAMKVKPTDLRGLADCLALNRPATIGQLSTYLGMRQSLFPTDWLRETNGALIYQEQINQICTQHLGMDPGTAEQVRMQLKDANADAPAVREFFSRLTNAVEPSQADELKNFLRENSGYLFNRAHALSYAILVNAGLSLKARMPSAFIYHVWRRRGCQADELRRGVMELATLKLRVIVPPAGHWQALPTYNDAHHRICLGLANLLAVAPRKYQHLHKAVDDLVRIANNPTKPIQMLEDYIRPFVAFARGEPKEFCAILDDRALADWFKSDAIVFGGAINNGRTLS